MFALAMLLREPLASRVPITLFLVSTLLAAWYGGLGPGLLATAAGVALAAFFLLPPQGSFAVGLADDWVRLAVLGLLGGVVSALFELVRRARAAAQRQSAQLAALLDNLPAGAVLAEAPSGRIVLSNRQSDDILGHSLGSVTDVAAYGLLHAHDAGGRPLAADEYPLVRALHGEIVSREELRYRQPDGRMVWLRVSAAPIRDADGRISAAVALFADIDAAKTAELELKEAQARLDVALEAGKLGAWQLDLASGRMTCNDGCKRNFGRDPAQRFDYADLLAAIHPDDRSAMQAAVGKAIADRTPYHAEYRAIWPDGSVHWIMAHGRASFDGAQAVAMAGVTADITERRNLEERLRDADRRKDEFIAQLSHELRNPLQAVSAAVQVLQARSADPDTVASSAGVIARQTRHLQRMVDDLLEIARIVEGKLELKRASVDARAVVAQAVEAVRPEVERRAQSLEVAPVPDALPVHADAGRLAQVVVNLLSNASKYTEEGGRIAVRAALEDGHVVISVEDNGLGIPREMLPRVFEPFVQVEAHRARADGGLGIGLTLVQRLVAMQGGSVAAESEGPGRGSRFVVRLPRVH